MAGTAAGRAKVQIVDDRLARYIPTPEEIERAAAEVRATWTEQRRKQARGKVERVRSKRLEITHARKGCTEFILRDL